MDIALDHLRRAASMQNYFDYMAERLGARGNRTGQPEVLEFTGFEEIEVAVIESPAPASDGSRTA